MTELELERDKISHLFSKEEIDAMDKSIDAYKKLFCMRPDALFVYDADPAEGYYVYRYRGCLLSEYGDTLSTDVAIYPSTPGRVYAVNLTLTYIHSSDILAGSPVSSSNCKQHHWADYVGLSETFKYCKNCDSKKEGG